MLTIIQEIQESFTRINTRIIAENGNGAKKATPKTVYHKPENWLKCALSATDLRFVIKGENL